MPPSHTPFEPPRTVLVTGGAQRLGREISLALAKAGWQVAVHCRHSQAQAEQTALDCARLSGTKAAVFCADLAVESQVRALVPQVVEKMGALHGVINSAALFEHDSVEDFGFANLERHLRTNTGAPVLLACALNAHLKQLNAPAGSGVVINMLDQKLWNPNPDFLSYTLSKAALESANTLLAQALAPQIRVVGVAPGLTLSSHLLTQAAFERLHTLSPLGRSSTPADVAAAVVFACHNASITGTTLLVDGGQHLQKFDRDFSMMDHP